MTSDQATVVLSDHEQTPLEVPDPDQVAIELPDNNLTVVKPVPSEDELEEIPEDEKMENQNEEKVKKKKNHKSDSIEETGVCNPLHLACMVFWCIYSHKSKFWHLSIIWIMCV